MNVPIAGPGFHEEKKYMLGPDADIEKILDSNMNDMCEYNLILLGDRVISLKNNHSMPPVWQDNLNFNYLLFEGYFPYDTTR